MSEVPPSKGTEGGKVMRLRVARGLYRGSSPIRNCPPLGPYGRTIPRVLWWS